MKPTMPTPVQTTNYSPASPNPNTATVPIGRAYTVDQQVNTTIPSTPTMPVR